MQPFWMSLLTTSTALTLSAAGAISLGQGYQMKSYLYSPIAPLGWQSAAAWCDAGDKVLAVTQSGQANKLTSPVRLIEWTGANFVRRAFQYGPSEGAAGSVYTALTPAGEIVGDNPESYVHSSNVENTSDPAYRMTRTVEFKLPGSAYDCAYQAQAAFMGATARHGITVFDDGKGVRYISSNRNGSAGLNLGGGTHAVSSSGDDYQWKNNGYTYTLHVGKPGATLNIKRSGQQVSNESFQAYSVSVKK